jgi:hypothetical protein
MISKNINSRDIVLGISNHIDVINDYYIVNSDENSADGVVFIRVYFQKTIPISSIDDALKKANFLLDLTIRGIPGIVSAGVEKHSGTREERLMIKTYGVNFTGVYSLQHKIPDIDYSNITSDNISEVGAYFGLGAARMSIIAELHNILSDMHYSIFTIIADEMVSVGKLTPITPNGPTYRKAPTLLKLSFEKTGYVIQKAIENSEVSPLYGFSASITMGQVPKFGSNFNSVLIDSKFVEKNTETVNDVLSTL